MQWSLLPAFRVPTRVNKRRSNLKYIFYCRSNGYYCRSSVLHCPVSFTVEAIFFIAQAIVFIAQCSSLPNFLYCPSNFIYCRSNVFIAQFSFITFFSFVLFMPFFDLVSFFSFILFVILSFASIVSCMIQFFHLGCYLPRAIPIFFYPFSPFFHCANSPFAACWYFPEALDLARFHYYNVFNVCWKEFIEWNLVIL